LPVERLHDLLQRPDLGQFIAEQPDRVLVRRWRAQVKAQESLPIQTVRNHDLHARVGEIVLRLQDQRLEHRHRVKRRATALGAITIAQALNHPAQEIHEIDRCIEDFKRIALLTEQRKMV